MTEPSNMKVSALKSILSIPQPTAVNHSLESHLLNPTWSRGCLPFLVMQVLANHPPHLSAFTHGCRPSSSLPLYPRSGSRFAYTTAQVSGGTFIAIEMALGFGKGYAWAPL